MVRWARRLSEEAYADVKDRFPILLRKLGRCVRSEDTRGTKDEPTD